MKTKSHVSRTAQPITGGTREADSITKPDGKKTRHSGSDPDQLGKRYLDAPGACPHCHKQGLGQDPEVIPPAEHWKAALGWGPQPPAPTIGELLPADVLEKFLDVWHTTGANLLYFVASNALTDLAEKPGYQKEIMDILESDIMERMGALASKWEGGNL